MPPFYVDVLLPLPTLRSRYTYIVQGSISEDELLHRLVCVTLGHGKVYTGIIVHIHQASPPDPNISYKPIITLLPYPPLPRSLVSLMSWTAWYYMCSEGDVFRAMIPTAYRPDGETLYCIDTSKDSVSDDLLTTLTSRLPTRFTLKQFKATHPSADFPLLLDLLRQGIIRVSDDQDIATPQVIRGWVVSLTFFADKSKRDLAKDHLRRSPSARRVFDQIESDIAQNSFTLQEAYPTTLTKLCKRYSTTLNIINKLKRLGVFETKHALAHTLTTSVDKAPEGQDHLSHALAHLENPLPIVLAHIPTSSLLHRVPFASISDCILSGGQVLLLCPTADALRTVAAELERTVSTSQVFHFHSETSAHRHNTAWYEALKGTPGVYIGLRKAVWLPLSILRLIIVIDEEHPAYRQFEPAPRFSAINVALVLGQLSSAPCVMTTATPSIERLLLAHEGKYTYLRLNSDHSTRQSIKIESISLKESFKKNKVRGRLLSFEALDALRETLQRGQKALVLHYRKGYSRYISCEECLKALECPQCKVTYRYFDTRQSIVCPLCGSHHAAPKSCPHCHSSALSFEGTGIERLKEEIDYLYPDAATAVIGEKDVQYDDIDIYLGSDYEIPLEVLRSVSLILITQFDLLMMKFDFKANEKAYRLLSYCQNEAPLLQSIIIQHLADKYNALEAFQKDSHTILFDYELQERAVVQYPPFSRMIDTYIESTDKRIAYHIAEQIVLAAHQDLPTLRVFGPAPLPIRKKGIQAGYKVTFMSALEENPHTLRQALHTLTQTVLHTHDTKGTRIYFDVDPL